MSADVHWDRSMSGGFFTHTWSLMRMGLMGQPAWSHIYIYDLLSVFLSKQFQGLTLPVASLLVFAAKYLDFLYHGSMPPDQKQKLFSDKQSRTLLM